MINNSVGVVSVAFALKVVPAVTSGATWRQVSPLVFIPVFLSALTALFTIYCARQLIYYSNNSILDTIIPYALYYMQIIMYVQTYSSIRGKLRGPLFRTLISYPSSVWFFATFVFCVVGLPLYLLANLVIYFKNGRVRRPNTEYNRSKQQNIRRLLFIVAILASLLGLYQSLTPGPITDAKIKMKSSTPLNEPYTLKVLQLSDIHLGPMMSVSTLQNISKQVVRRKEAKKIDEEFVVLMTGDFYTSEAHDEETALSRGLEPLKGIKDRVYACFGNHDHELSERVTEELERSNVKLLIDQIDHIKITRGSAQGKYIQIIGLDYNFPFQNPKAIIETFFQEHKSEIERNDLLVRLIMLHNPQHFKYIPDLGDGVPTATFGGHFHGAQFKLPFTARTLISEVLGAPDYGFFCPRDGQLVRLEDTRNIQKICQENRIFYAHTGTGYYGIPLRWGTQNENVNVFTFTIQ